MTNNQAHKAALRNGKTNGTNLPFMPEGKYFSVGNNSRYGLVKVTEGNGAEFFEGRIRIKNLLSTLPPGNSNEASSQVEDFIMQSYHNFWDYRNHPENHDSPPIPILEVLTYRG